MTPYVAFDAFIVVFGTVWTFGVTLPLWLSLWLNRKTLIQQQNAFILLRRVLWESGPTFALVAIVLSWVLG